MAQVRDQGPSLEDIGRARNQAQKLQAEINPSRFDKTRDSDDIAAALDDARRVADQSRNKSSFDRLEVKGLPAADWKEKNVGDKIATVVGNAKDFVTGEVRDDAAAVAGFASDSKPSDTATSAAGSAQQRAGQLKDSATEAGAGLLETAKNAVKGALDYVTGSPTTTTTGGEQRVGNTVNEAAELKSASHDSAGAADTGNMQDKMYQAPGAELGVGTGETLSTGEEVRQASKEPADSVSFKSATHKPVIASPVESKDNSAPQAGNETLSQYGARETFDRHPFSGGEAQLAKDVQDKTSGLFDSVKQGVAGLLGKDTSKPDTAGLDPAEVLKDVPQELNSGASIVVSGSEAGDPMRDPATRNAAGASYKAANERLGTNLTPPPPPEPEPKEEPAVEATEPTAAEPAADPQAAAAEKDAEALRGSYDKGPVDSLKDAAKSVVEGPPKAAQTPGDDSAQQSGGGVMDTLRRSADELMHGGGKAQTASSPVGGEYDKDVARNQDRSKQLDDPQQRKIYQGETYQAAPNKAAAEDRQSDAEQLKEDQSSVVAGKDRDVSGAVPHGREPTATKIGSDRYRSDLGMFSASAQPPSGREVKDAQQTMSRTRDQISSEAKSLAGKASEAATAAKDTVTGKAADITGGKDQSGAGEEAQKATQSATEAAKQVPEKASEAAGSARGVLGDMVEQGTQRLEEMKHRMTTYIDPDSSGAAFAAHVSDVEPSKDENDDLARLEDAYHRDMLKLPGDRAVDHIHEAQAARADVSSEPAFKRDTLTDKVLYPLSKDARDESNAVKYAQSYHRYKQEKATEAGTEEPPPNTRATAPGQEGDTNNPKDKSEHTAAEIQHPEVNTGVGIQVASGGAGGSHPPAQAADNSSPQTAKAAMTTAHAASTGSGEPVVKAEDLPSGGNPSAEECIPGARSAKEAGAKVKDAAGAVAEKAGEVKESVKATAGEALESAKAKAGEVEQSVKAKADEAGAAVKNTAHRASEAAGEAKEGATAKAGELKDSTQGAAEDVAAGAAQAKDGAKQKARGAAESTRETVEAGAVKAEDKASELSGKAKGTAEQAREKAAETAESVKQRTSEATEAATERAQGVAEQAKETVSQVEQRAEQAWESTRQTAKSATDTVVQTTDEVTRRAEETVEGIATAAVGLVQKLLSPLTGGQHPADTTHEETRDTARQAAESAKHDTEAAAESAGSAARDAAYKAESGVKEGAEKVREAVAQAKDTATENVEGAWEKTKDRAAELKDIAGHHADVAAGRTPPQPEPTAPVGEGLIEKMSGLFSRILPTAHEPAHDPAHEPTVTVHGAGGAVTGRSSTSLDMPYGSVKDQANEAKERAKQELQDTTEAAKERLRASLDDAAAALGTVAGHAEGALESVRAKMEELQRPTPEAPQIPAMPTMTPSEALREQQHDRQ